MQSGNIFTIEPILTLHQSTTGLRQWNDNFTVISANNPNAQFEHTVLIVPDGCEVLTLRSNEEIPNPNGSILNANSVRINFGKVHSD